MKPSTNPPTATVQSVTDPSGRRRLTFSNSLILPNATRRQSKKRRPIVLIVKAGQAEATAFEPVIQFRPVSTTNSSTEAKS